MPSRGHPAPPWSWSTTVARTRSWSSPARNAALRVEDIRHLDVAAGDVVVTQNEVPIAVSAAAVEVARASGATSISNPAPATRDSLAVARAADVVVVNESELAFLSGHPIDELSPVDELRTAMAVIRDDGPVIVTLGRAWGGRVDRR